MTRSDREERNERNEKWKRKQEEETGGWRERFTAVSDNQFQALSRERELAAKEAAGLREVEMGSGNELGLEAEDRRWKGIGSQMWNDDELCEAPLKIHQLNYQDTDLSLDKEEVGMLAGAVGSRSWRS